MAAFLSLPCALAQKAPEAPAPDEPQVLSRDQWGAAPAKADLMQDQKPSEIILHHTGEKQRPNTRIETKMRGLQGFSMRPGKVGSLSKPAWGDVPYHYYIDVYGKIAEGRNLSYAGDAITDFDNDGRIQIAVEGDFEKEEPSKAQLDALRKLVLWLAWKFGIAAEGISGHGDHDRTDCPGANLKPFIADLKQGVEAEFAAGDK